MMEMGGRLSRLRCFNYRVKASRCPINMLTDFHTIWYEPSTTGGQARLVLFNFLYLVIAT